MHTPCPMANKPKTINLAITAAAVLVLSSLLVVPMIDARNLADENNNSDVHPKQIFILAGQSNMAGRAGLMGRWGQQYYDRNFTPPESRPDPTRIFRLNAQLGWEVAQESLHADIDNVNKTSGMGPGMAFANAIKERVGSTIGLVPCAVGDTNISQWQRGEALYINMTKRAKVAVQGGGEIKALLWYQGEKDSTNMDLVNQYKDKMESLILNVREDLNLPSLPILQVAIATGDPNTNMTCMESLRAIQMSINLPNVVTADAKGLPNNGPHDEVHLNVEAQVKLGHMLAQNYLDHFLVNN